MGAGLPGVMPEPLRRNEIRSIGRQRNHCELAVVLGTARQEFGLLVIRRVVLAAIDPVASPVKMREQVALDEGELRLGIAGFGLMPPPQSAARHTDRPQNFLRVAFAALGILGLRTASRPSAIQGRRLTKGRFSLINDQRPFAPGVFFDSDAWNESSGFGCGGRLAPIESWAGAPKSSTP